MSDKDGTEMKKKSRGLEMSCLKSGDLGKTEGFFLEESEIDVSTQSVCNLLKFAFCMLQSLTGIIANSSLYSNLLKNEVHIIE